MLKTFQCLGYFCHPEVIPGAIVNHIRDYLKLGKNHSAIVPLRSSRRYKEVIRKYLAVSIYDKRGQKLMAIAVANAANFRDHPADLVNIAIEELVKERYELPGFSTIDRLVLHIREVINSRLFKRVARSLSPSEIAYLDSLLTNNPDFEAINLNKIKQLPKKATLSQIKALLAKFSNLMNFGDAKRLLSNIPNTKIIYFAAYARTLDAAEFQDIQLPKRRTLLLCLLYRSQVKARDYLIEMFLKRIAHIHNRGKEKLVELRERHRAATAALLEVLGEIIEASDEIKDETALGRQIQDLIATHGGSEKLRSQCAEITAYNSDNYLPLLYQFYSHYRAALFELVENLDIRSTTQDQSLIFAVKFLLSNKQRRGRWLPPSVDLSFASNVWRKLIDRSFALTEF